MVFVYTTDALECCQLAFASDDPEVRAAGETVFSALTFRMRSQTMPLPEAAEAAWAVIKHLNEAE